MIRTVLIAGGIFAFLVASSQQPAPPVVPRNSLSALYNPYTDRVIVPGERLNTLRQSVPRTPRILTALEEYVGTSVYDLQTNNSIQNRIIADESGVAAVFTYSGNPSNGTFPDRGTGYNFRSGGEWADAPNSRIENTRCGWPSLLHLGDGSEVVINHSGSGGIRMWKRPSAGTGSWSGSVIPTATGMDLVWPRAVAGGNDGNTIHMICLTSPEGIDGAPYEGLNGAILYFRSTDGGASWDITDSLLNGIDASNFVGFSADTYAIHARGEKVAIGVFGEFHDSFVLVSEDNGETWDRSVIWDFPIDLYSIDDGSDVEPDGIQDTLLTTDGAGAIFVDEDDHVHAAFGILFMTDTPGEVDSAYTYFPLVGDVLYWNDTFTSSDEIASIAISPDNDPDEPSGITQVGQYGNSGIASHPQFAQDDDGTIYLTYMALNDLYFNGTEYFRHVYAVKSEDGGLSWTEPSDITPDIEEDGWEYTYPSMHPYAYGGKIHLVVQRDDEPGIHVQPEDNEDPVADNDHIYVCVTSDLVAVEEQVLESRPLSVFPNPSSGIVTLQSGARKGSLVRVLDVSGRVVLHDRMKADGRWSADLSRLSPGMYGIHIVDGAIIYQGRLMRQ